MNIDEPDEKHIIDEDFHGEVDENLFQVLVADDILDPDLDIDNPNMEGVRQGAGQQGSTKNVINASTNIWIRRQAFASLQHGFLRYEENVVLYNFETPKRCMGMCYDK